MLRTFTHGITGTLLRAWDRATTQPRSYTNGSLLDAKTRDDCRGARGIPSVFA